MGYLKNMYNQTIKLKNEAFDFFEAILIFLFCSLSTVTLYFAHDSHFALYIEKGFLVEFSLFLSIATSFIVFYEFEFWRNRKKS